MPPNVSKSASRQRSNSQGSGSDSYESDGCPPESSYDRGENYWNRADRRQNVSGGKFSLLIYERFSSF